MGKLARFLKRMLRPITNASPRGKVRWAVLGILLLALVAGAYDYAKPYNQAIAWVNAQLDRHAVTGRLTLPNIPEKPFSLGLDLKGGAHLVYQANLSELPVAEQAEGMERLRDRIERRVNSLGVSEPRVQVSGQDRLVVELAGVDVVTAIQRIGETPILEFREVNNQAPQQELTPEQKQEMGQFNAEQQKKAQDLRARIATGRESFEALAKEFSEDLPSKEKEGDFGAVTSRTHPELIEAARNTIIGRVVPGVADLEDGYYIIRVDDRKETDVEMDLSHLLICYEGANNCETGRSRQEALDYITNLAKEVTTANFAAKAKEFSNDATAQTNSGDLGWIAPAATVESFETAAKATRVGTISAPIETEFGFHLIYKRAERPFGETFLHIIKLDKKQEADYLPKQEQYKETGLTGKNVIDAQMTFAAQTSVPQVSIKFDDEGTRLFAELTRRNIGREIAIYLDGAPISIPTVQTEIANGEAVITGNFSIDLAQELARQLKDGALPVSVSLIQQQNIGASLGAESLQRSLYAGVVGIILVAIFMILYYRGLGFIAVLALCVYTLLGLSLFKLIGATLTLSGIAGYLLSIGMAVDANVLVFERFREERVRGRSMMEAMEIAFNRAWPSIRDSNVTTLMTCAILAYLGTSIIQGFAVTLGIGVMVSMFSAIVVTKTLLTLVFGWRLRDWTLLFGSGFRLRG